MAYFPTSTTDRQARATQLNGEAQDGYDRIRQNRTLSEEGKRAQLASTYLDYKRSVTGLATEEDTATALRRETLYRKYFGSSTPLTSIDVMRQRDAMDRASRIDTEDEAVRLLTAARLQGDVGLAKAVAQHCYSQLWTDALTQWAEGNVTTEEEITELYRIDSQGSGDSQDLANLMAAGMAFSIDPPLELERMSAAEIRTLADLNPSGVRSA